MTQRACLTLTNITKSFQHNNLNVPVIKNVSATFIQGTSYALTGPSGSGKSTLLHLITTLDTPDSGTVFYHNKNIHSLPGQERSFYLNTTVGLVFQSSYWIKELSVLENVMLPGVLQNNNTQSTKKKALELLDYVSLADHAHKKARELSGGQQQRASLARALINNPAFLIADEPTGNLDANSANIILSLINSCKKERGMGIIISSHDHNVIQHMDEIYFLHNQTLSKK